MKPKITAYAMKQIVEAIFNANDYEITDESSEHYGKTMLEVINAPLFVYKKRLVNEKTYIRTLVEQTNSAFCLLELNSDLKMQFYKNIFMASPTVQLTYLVPSDVVTLLDDFTTTVNTSLCGESFTVSIGGNTYKAKAFLSSLTETNLLESSPIGFASICSLSISFVLSDDIESIDDYTFQIGTTTELFHDLPVIKVTGQKTFVSKPIPLINATTSVGQLNLSSGDVVGLVFYAANNPIVADFKSMAHSNQINNNKAYYLKISDGTTTWTRELVLVNLNWDIENGTGFKVYTANFTGRGKRDGT